MRDKGELGLVSVLMQLPIGRSSVAEVTVQLKNQGEEAFRPQDFGKSIVITRRFTKDGSSSYKIRSKDGKLISTKREDLQAICDHMNIQVDNPMNVLTQGKEIGDSCSRMHISS